MASSWAPSPYGVLLSTFRVWQALEITQTRATFMGAYVVPSGGDWSVHRGAAVQLSGSARASVQVRARC